MCVTLYAFHGIMPRPLFHDIFLIFSRVSRCALQVFGCILSALRFGSIVGVSIRLLIKYLDRIF